MPSIVIAELEYGLFLKDSEKLWDAYRTILKGRLKILDFTAEVATTFAGMKAAQTRIGKTVDDFDLSIAATAVHHDLTLATLNHQHFKLIKDLKWEDWSTI